MDVSFVGENGISVKKTMVAKYENDDESQPFFDPSQTKNTDTGTSTATESHQHRSLHWGRLVARLLLNTTGEMIGTFMLTLVICSVVSAAVVSGAQVGLWQVAVVCGLGVSVSIYCTSYVSDAHLNPAITVAFAILRPSTFSWKRILPYVTAQMLGGVLAGAVLYGFNSNAIALFEEGFDIQRGTNESIITAMMFGEYFPNPSLYDHSSEENLKVISTLGALVVEAWTTCILAFVIFSLTDKANTAVGQKNKLLAPLLIGLTVALMISLYGHLTQVGMNPARDFGPRIVAACAGWGEVAVPGPRNGFWVYILGPLLGAPIGAAVNDLLLSRVLKFTSKIES